MHEFHALCVVYIQSCMWYMYELYMYVSVDLQGGQKPPAIIHLPLLCLTPVKQYFSVNLELIVLFQASCLWVLSIRTQVLTLPQSHHQGFLTPLTIVASV